MWTAYYWSRVNNQHMSKWESSKTPTRDSKFMQPRWKWWIKGPSSAAERSESYWCVSTYNAALCIFALFKIVMKGFTFPRVWMHGQVGYRDKLSEMHLGLLATAKPTKPRKPCSAVCMGLNKVFQEMHGHTVFRVVGRHSTSVCV